jgi:ribonuclease HII
MLLNNLIKGVLEAGCDEAGRGCLAGPVFAAAVILPDNFYSEILNDSKKLTEKQRYELRPLIEDQAIAWAVGMYDNNEIDEVNILNASIYSMHRALNLLKVRPQHLIIDGNRFKPWKNIPYTTIVKGDEKYLSIAAASVLAKTYRDDFMIRLHEESPLYGWHRNKGYPTKFHREALVLYGITPHHRKTFKLFDPQLSIDFEE